MYRINKWLIAIIVILLTTTIYFVWRINNLKNILEVNTDTPGLIPKTLEGEIMAIKEYKNSLVKLETDLNNLAVLEFDDTEEIPTTDADDFIRNYLNNRATGDNTHTILFDWPKIITAMKQVYGVSGAQWDDLNYWNDKAFIIYPANYGSTGHPAGQNINQTTAIFQLAKQKLVTPTSPEKWEAITNSTNMVYNFGDLKPPKGAIQ
jgi:hypothetical protein